MRFGMMLEKCGRDDEAEQQFRELVRLNPDYAMGHLKLAETLRGRMRFEQAIAEYKKALEINPNLSAARAGLQATERARASILDGS
jgi:tetratricopeptide (TPR) repeat protein